jgi:RNA polymerase sigma factor (sigma-70 family)
MHNDVFLMLFQDRCRKLRQFKGKNGCSLASWIRLVTVRIVLNNLRKNGFSSIRWQPKRLCLGDLPELMAESASSAGILDKSEKSPSLDEHVKRLSPRDRLFFKLHYIHELAIPEVSEIMKITTQNAHTVKHRLTRRLKLLVEQTSADNDSGI